MTQVLAPPSGGGAGIDDDDPRLTNARTPVDHAPSHEDGGSDELSLTAAQISDFATAVSAGIATWVGAAPSDMNEILELVSRFTTDEATVSALTTAVAAKMLKSANLSDVADVPTARSNILAAPSINPTAVKTANYNAAANDFVPVDTTSGNVTITLPTTPADGTRVCVKHIIQGSTNIVTINCGGSDVLNKAGGSTSATLPLLAQAMQFQYKASSGIWYITADDEPLSQLDLRFVKRLSSDFGSVFAGLITGAWGNATTYTQGQIVTYLGASYVNLVASNLNIVPGSDGTKWALLASAGTSAGQELGAVTLATSPSVITGTTAVDIASMTISPATTSAILIVVEGLLGLNQNGAAAGADCSAWVQVVDDLGSIIGIAQVRQVWPVATGAGTAHKMGARVHAEFPVTPNSTSRTYKLQARTNNASAQVAVFGADASGSVGNKGELRLSWKLR